MTRATGWMTAAAVALTIGLWLPAHVRAQTQTPAKPALTGAWTLNADLSDKPAERGDRGDRGDQGDRGGYGGGRRRGGGMGRGGGGGFGRGGGFGGGGGGGARPQMDPQEMARMRDAMRDITNPGNHLTIVETGSMIVITTSEGRTTRLAPDNSKVKDENTKVERRTKWDGDKLVSEISGVGPGKITQTFTIDPEQHQLRITVVMPAGGGRFGQQQGQGQRQERTITNVYDRDAQQ